MTETREPYQLNERRVPRSTRTPRVGESIRDFNANARPITLVVCDVVRLHHPWQDVHLVQACDVMDTGRERPRVYAVREIEERTRLSPVWIVDPTYQSRPPATGFTTPTAPRITDAELASALRTWAQCLANQRSLQDPVALLLSEPTPTDLRQWADLRADVQAAELAVHTLVERLAGEIGAEAGR